MLILTRKPGTSIMIDDDIEIMLLQSKGNETKIGIIAPIEISVHRKEVYERILKNYEIQSIKDAPRKQNMENNNAK